MDSNVSAVGMMLLITAGICEENMQQYIVESPS